MTLFNQQLPQRIYWLFFMSLTLLYISFTPGTIEGQGYNQENLVAAGQVLTNVVNAVTRQPLVQVEWTRHGCIEPLLELPFVAASRLFFGASEKWPGRLAIFVPILATSLLCTLLLIWAHRLTSSLRWSILLAVAAGLGTMLWPYAYIGLETTQSLALLAAAFITLGRMRTGSWREVLLLAVCCGVTLTAKSSGVFLVPAIGFLVFVYFWRQNTLGEAKWKLIGLLGLIVLLFGLNLMARSRYWGGTAAGAAGYYSQLLIDSPLTAAFQAFSYFGSPNKSLLLYCPIVLLSLLALRAAWRLQSAIVIFSLLTLGGLIAGFAVTRMWAEETWGPRYLHAAVAPLLLCLAAASSEMEFRWRRHVSVLALLLLGLGVSLLGTLFSYGSLHRAAIETSQNTLEALQYSPRWNHIQFNWTLLRLWIRRSVVTTQEEDLWPKPVGWWFSKPDDAPPEKTVDLRQFATPQPIILQRWRPSVSLSAGAFTVLRVMCLAFLLIGLAVLVRAWRWAGHMVPPR
ncbi:MAG: hypothetical protein ABI882_17475 [Acidobacteriota bacterium]